MNTAKLEAILTEIQNIQSSYSELDVEAIGKIYQEYKSQFKGLEVLDLEKQLELARECLSKSKTYQFGTKEYQHWHAKARKRLLEVQNGIVNDVHNHLKLSKGE